MIKYFNNVFNFTAKNQINFYNSKDFYSFILSEKYQGHTLPEIDE